MQVQQCTVWVCCTFFACWSIAGAMCLRESRALLHVLATSSLFPFFPRFFLPSSLYFFVCLTCFWTDRNETSAS
jgi:hypothetical protein